jgi:hypothetical protein
LIWEGILAARDKLPGKNPIAAKSSQSAQNKVPLIGRTSKRKARCDGKELLESGSENPERKQRGCVAGELGLLGYGLLDLGKELARCAVRF